MYNECADVLANIGVQCNEKTTAGFTGRGIIGLKRNATPVLDAAGDVVSVTDASKVLVDNVWANAFDGTQKQMNTENGRPMWHTDLAMRIPRVSAITARDNAKALATNSLWGIFEREDGTYLALGFAGKMIATAETQAENAAGGDYQITLGTDESVAETLFVDDPSTAVDPKTAKEKFNAMWAEITGA